MPLTIRAQLTLWYTAVLCAALSVFGLGLYLAETQLSLAQLDAELGRGSATVAGLVTNELEQGYDLRTAVLEAREDFPATLAVGVFDSGGSALTQSGEPGLNALPPESLQGATTVSRNLETPDGDWRIHAERYGHVAGQFYVAASVPLAGLQRERVALGRALGIGIPLALALAGAGGFFIARRALRPVAAMARQASEISERTPGFRLRVPNPHDELGELGTAFNGLLGRLEDALHAQRSFMADASHELRTPVSVVRTTTEVILSQQRTAEEYRDALVTVARQVGRLAQMVDDMFTLARADAGALTCEKADLYLDELLLECVADVRPLARQQRIEVCRGGAKGVPFHGDERLLQQLLLNLLHNALRHTPEGGRVQVGLELADSALEIAVSDTGHGIPPADRERIFERFVRLDAARGAQGGAGLGLAIARSIAELHGGTLSLAESSASGSVFVLRLPRTDTAR